VAAVLWMAMVAMLALPITTAARASAEKPNVWAFTLGFPRHVLAVAVAAASVLLQPQISACSRHSRPALVVVVAVPTISIALFTEEHRVAVAAAVHYAS
jgi:hypothetical protein